MPTMAEQFHKQLYSSASGLPADFSVVAAHQVIPGCVLNEIDEFIHVFERVTTRLTWQQTVLRDAPDIARHRRNEVCFFSAWDLHLPPEQPHRWQLIEFNDNGSGFLFSGQINQLYYDFFTAGLKTIVSAPPSYLQLSSQIKAMIEAETQAFFGKRPEGLFLILDDDASLKAGKFRHEHQLLATIAQEQGWQTAIAPPEALRWNGEQLLTDGNPVAFVVNRSTDFLWQDESSTPLAQAYRTGQVYIAPNPFSYSTRSDKRLLEYLSHPEKDKELAVRPEEREILSRHIPPTYLLTPDNINYLAARKADYIFKPTHGHAGLGILNSHDVGRHRLHRLLAKGQSYVAQQLAEKSHLMLGTGQQIWTDLRVWAYRGERFLISGRASGSKERLDLNPPGGWLPTFAAMK